MKIKNSFNKDDDFESIEEKIEENAKKLFGESFNDENRIANGLLILSKYMTVNYEEGAEHDKFYVCFDEDAFWEMEAGDVYRMYLYGWHYDAFDSIWGKYV